MNPQIAGIVLLGLGLALAALAGFAWPTLSKLPMYRLRTAIFGPRATRILTIVFALLAAVAGGFLLLTSA